MNASDGHVHLFLPVHNRRSHTYRLLQMLKAQTLSHFHLVLIDDGSADGTENMVLHEMPEATILRGNGRWWWAGSLQRGLLWARENGVSGSDVIVVMNNDTSIEPTFLETGVRLVRSLPRSLVAAQSYGARSRELFDPGVRFDWRTLTMSLAAAGTEIHCLSTRGFFATYADLLRIGGFHPVLLPHYLSDFEYSYRAWRKGFGLKTYRELRLWVDEETTGVHRLPPQSIRQCFQRQFSRRSAANVFAWVVFIGLACPQKWMVINWCRVIARSASELLSCFRNSVLRPMREWK